MQLKCVADLTGYSGHGGRTYSGFSGCGLVARSLNSPTVSEGRSTFGPLLDHLHSQNRFPQQLTVELVQGLVNAVDLSVAGCCRVADGCRSFIATATA